MRRWWVACYTWTLEQLVSLFAMYSALRWRCSIQDKNLYEPDVSSKTYTFTISERSLSRWGEKIQNFSPGGGRDTRKFLNILKWILLSISPLIFFIFFFRSLPAFFIAPFLQTKTGSALSGPRYSTPAGNTFFYNTIYFSVTASINNLFQIFPTLPPPPPSTSKNNGLFLIIIGCNTRSG